MPITPDPIVDAGAVGMGGPSAQYYGEETIFSSPQEESEVNVGPYWIWVMSDGWPLLHARRHGRGMVVVGQQEKPLTAVGRATAVGQR